MLQVAAPTLDPRQLLKALRAFKKGDFSVRLPLDLTGIGGEIAATLNGVVGLQHHMTPEIAPISPPFPQENKSSQRAKPGRAHRPLEASHHPVHTRHGATVTPP